MVLMDYASIASTMISVKVDKADPPISTNRSPRDPAGDRRRRGEAGRASAACEGSRRRPRRQHEHRAPFARVLRDEGLLEFRRGRGISVAGTPERGAVVQRARELVAFARSRATAWTSWSRSSRRSAEGELRNLPLEDGLQLVRDLLRSFLTFRERTSEHARTPVYDPASKYRIGSSGRRSGSLYLRPARTCSRRRFVVAVAWMTRPSFGMNITFVPLPRPAQPDADQIHVLPAQAMASRGSCGRQSRSCQRECPRGRLGQPRSQRPGNRTPYDKRVEWRG